jgi:hypothetical protein
MRVEVVFCLLGFLQIHGDMISLDLENMQGWDLLRKPAGELFQHMNRMGQ